MEPSSEHLLEINLFNNLRRDLEVSDVDPLGRRFTWYHLNGCDMSGIDRVFISEEWVDFWGSVALWVLPRDVYDHYPILLKPKSWNWGLKPFRFNNFWLQNQNFKKVMEEAKNQYEPKMKRTTTIISQIELQLLNLHNFMFHASLSLSQFQDPIS